MYLVELSKTFDAKHNFQVVSHISTSIFCHPPPEIVHYVNLFTLESHCYDFYILY